MSRHTPGPWGVTSRQGDWWDSVVFLQDSRNLEICQCFHDDSDLDECTANARLIAAAPDLLTALKEVLFIAEVSDRWGPEQTKDFLDATSKAESAIAKAEGENQ
jgi:hypothetical protein